MKSRMKLLISFALLLALTNTAYAGEWKKVYPRDAKVELRTDWSWTAPENGRYYQKWSDNYGKQMFTGTWRSGTYPRIQIILQQLAPQRYWSRVDEINEKSLTAWNHLKKVGVSEIEEIPCDAGDCLAFKASSSSCVGFQYVDGTLGDRAGTQGSDLVSGYYCAGPLEEMAPEQVNEFLRSIVVKKKKWK